MTTHKLNDNWVFWYAPRGRKAKADAEHYDVNLKQMGKFGSVEEFYSFYCYFKRPSEIDIDHKIMMFRDGHKPMWEEFQEGGTWIIHFKRKDWQSLNRKWEELLLACIGEDFEDSNVIGVVLSLRERRNLLEIWMKDRRESEKIRIGEKLRVVLNMDPENLTFFFKEHSKSLTVQLLEDFIIIKEKSTMKGAESYTFVKTPLETPLPAPKDLNNLSELDQFQLK